MPHHSESVKKYASVGGQKYYMKVCQSIAKDAQFCHICTRECKTLVRLRSYCSYLRINQVMTLLKTELQPLYTTCLCVCQIIRAVGKLTFYEIIMS